MRISCWTPKSGNTLSEYDILIDFPLQQWLHDRASMLRYTYSTLPAVLLTYIGGKLFGKKGRLRGCFGMASGKGFIHYSAFLLDILYSLRHNFEIRDLSEVRHTLFLV